MTAPQLHLVNADTGELVEDERDILIEQLKSELTGKSLQIGKLKRELREFRAVEPEAETIRDVLTYWRDRCKPRAAIAPAGKRWEKARARLREKLEDRPPMTVEELKLAVDGALLDRWHTQKGMEHRLDAEFLFRSYESVERLRDLAIGFKAHAGIGLGDLLEVTNELVFVNWKHLLATCLCEHRRLEHSKPDPNFFGREACLIPGCECADFDLDFEDLFNQRTQPWLKRWVEGVAA